MKADLRIDPRKLLYGPYTAPQVRRGDRLFCDIRGTVKVGGYTSAPIPWPRILKTGKPCLVLCGDLIRAVKAESELAVAHHWGVGVVTVWSWRKALGVGRITEGTARLYRGYYAIKLTEDVSAKGRDRAKLPGPIERMRQTKIGRPMHPNTRDALLVACRRKPRKRWAAYRGP